VLWFRRPVVAVDFSVVRVHQQGASHAARRSTARIALVSPAWASEMTSYTPVSPRFFSKRRKAVQKAPSP
jgi:hypothetical protein